VLINLSIDALTVDSNEKKSKKDNATKAFGAGSIDWPELHAREQDKLNKRASSARQQRGASRSIAQLINKIAKINKKSECRVSISNRSFTAQPQQEAQQDR